MSAYTKPIVRFGLITPTVFNLFLLGGVLAGVNKLNQVRAANEARYKEHTSRIVAMKALDTQLAPRRKVFDDQKHILQADPAQLFTRILDTMLPKYKEFELERSSLVFPQDRGRVGKHVHADAARVKSSFEGGIGPMQGQANVFYRYFPEKLPAAIDRYQNETRRLYGVMDGQLARQPWLAREYSIADIACYPWVAQHDWSGVPLEPFANLQRWFKAMGERPAVQAGMKVPTPRAEASAILASARSMLTT